MTAWIDAQLSPALARWLSERFGVTANHVRDLGLVGATDWSIFEAAGKAAAVIVTKDRDFVELAIRRGPPPHVIWLTCGNTSNAEMMHIFETTFEKACDLIAAGEVVVEIKG